MAQGSNQIYLSYARGANKSLVERLLSASEDKELKLFQSAQKPDQANQRILAKAGIKYDENSLDYGGSIQGFMDELAASKQLILIISDEYLRSPYCMYECISAYNKIGNEFYPAVIFQKNAPDAKQSILGFDDGLPTIDCERLKQHWTTELKNLGSEDDASVWYQKTISMAEELEAWLIGRRGAGKPDRNLLTYDPKEKCTDVAIESYIEWALSPIENCFSCPSSDKLQEQSKAVISNLLRDDPGLAKALNNDIELNGADHYDQLVEKILTHDAARFVSETLSKAMISEAKRRTKHLSLNLLRLNTDRIFTELAKYGIRIETLHHQLQVMNDRGEISSFAVDTEAELPEMTMSRLGNRKVAYKKIEPEDTDRYWYVGEKEYLISKDNPLELAETQQDARDHLTANFISQAYQLYRSGTDSSGRPKRRRGRASLENMKTLVFEDIKADKSNQMFFKIEGLEDDDAQELAKKLRESAILEDVPVVYELGKPETKIKMHANWIDAIYDYYEARESIEDMS